MSKRKTPSRRATYCWDTSVFVAWIKNEEGAPLADIGLVTDELDKNQSNLLVPMPIVTEILEARHSPDQIAKFNAYLQRSNVILADTTYPIARKASDLRSAFLAQNRKLKTPDAQVIATAIVYRANALHSLDPDILNVAGDPAIEGLRISRPMTIHGQRSVFPNDPENG